ncbi:integration host factor subunit alpha [Desulfopila aestuarii]|uniref:Integration host factor subunit alpha n=1 Tax=Desulfopila aestuarii DSM 18488 TaxID=1121416 RepID=A0A1M7YAQ9_9BACT|nr:integration host factor subunit alpha [Desulfopila aestuarii]SHO49689.1 integration host factor subunit alpha [Desulfopila aestuarii DSM 18488]
MTLTKTDIVREVFMRHDDITKAQASNALESFLNLAKAVLISGDDLLLSGFGKFNVRNKKERKGRNPQTGSELMLSSRRVVTFCPSGILRAKVNEQ